MTKRRLSESLNHDIHEYGIDIEAREVYINSHFDHDDEIDYRISSNFIRNIRTLDNYQSATKSNTILVHCNIGGGDFDYGMAMYDSIKTCSCPIIVLVYAHAESMSSIFPQAADLRIIMPNALVMLHEGSLSLEGTNKQVVSFVKYSEKQKEQILQIYLEKCKGSDFFKNKTETKIRHFLQDKFHKNEDWYMTARESVDYGLMDAVLGDSGYEDIGKIKTHYDTT